MVSELTFCMYSNMAVRRTWEAADGEVELLLVGKGMAISGFQSLSTQSGLNHSLSIGCVAPAIPYPP